MNWSKEACIKYNNSENGKAKRKAYGQSDKFKAISSRWKNSEHGKSVQKKYRDLWYKTEKGRKYAMWQAAKLRAKKKNLEFSITVDDIIFPEICPLLGFKIKIEEFGIRHDSPSLDRKDSTKGYIKENIWVISTRANILKHNATLQELELLVKNLKLCGFTYHA